MIHRAVTIEERQWTIALVCAVAGMLINAMTYDTIYWVSSGSLFWLCAGLLAAEMQRAG
jgi:hypothetical protein